ncbi:9399_t:CDS:2 [Paraglomus occultum]|uniref:9399_t:CDS:1 n=1 Tax=Paraglomus occultum TaxID=144539 RepID=A0A9N8YT04_9GLOM|nr:9399_t:CDS:2 [Paraglomus occultum]
MTLLRSGLLGRSYTRPLRLMIARRAKSTQTFVSTGWLEEKLNEVVPVDGSWHMPWDNRDAYMEYLQKRIEGARFFGIDEIKDKNSNLPHMLPEPETFAAAVGDLGITETDHVVVYDTAGLFSAPRVFWTFKVFGHKKVSILEGGLPKWEAEKRPLEAGSLHITPKSYKVPTVNKSLVRNYQEIIDNIEHGPNAETFAQVVDARPEGRYNGTEPEARPGLPSGHMPFSANIPFPSVIDKSTGALLDSDALKKLCESKNIDLNKPIIVSCGSGVTATIVMLALEKAGANQLAIYDGSWTEYAANEKSPIVGKK